MTYLEIPLSTGSQTFRSTLLGVQYQIAITWRGVAGWIMDIADASGNAMASGIALVPGTDLLGQYAHLGIGGALYVATDGDPDADLTFESLGTTSHLYFVTP